MKPGMVFDIAYLLTHFMGSAGYKARYGLSIARNMFYLLRK